MFSNSFEKIAGGQYFTSLHRFTNSKLLQKHEMESWVGGCFYLSRKGGNTFIVVKTSCFLIMLGMCILAVLKCFAAIYVHPVFIYHNDLDALTAWPTSRDNISNVGPKVGPKGSERL